MYSVIIADDFAYDRKQIREALSTFEDFSLSVVAECENAYDALEAIRNLEPDILICDIEMPGINGIELANQLRGENERIRIIFCSLYDKVHYLQEAIKLHCDGYIMKPFKDEELRASVQSAVLGLYDAEEQQKTYANLRKTMDDNRFLRVSELFSDILQGYEGSERMMSLRWRQLCGEQVRCFRLAVLEINPYGMLSPMLTEEETLVVPYRVYQTLKHFSGWKQEYYVVRISEKRYAVVFCYEEKALPEHTRSRTESALDELIRNLRETAAIDLTATFSEQVCLLSDLKDQYAACSKRLEGREEYGGDSIIFKSEAGEATDANLTMRIQEHIRQADLKTVCLQSIAEVFSYSPNYLNHIFKETTGQTILDYITVCRIEKAKELMRTTGIRLAEIATSIGYSHATYLSIVFKRHEGITPKQYMEKMR